MAIHRLLTGKYIFHIMKTYWGSESIAPRVLNLDIDGSEWSASRTSGFTPGVTASQYPLERRLGGSQNRSGSGGEEEISHHCPCRGLNPGRPSDDLLGRDAERKTRMNDGK
jgi:hypothetical protein